MGDTGLRLACEQALLFGQAKRASRERASEGPRKGETRFTRPNRRTCSQARLKKTQQNKKGLIYGTTDKQKRKFQDE